MLLPSQRQVILKAAEDLLRDVKDCGLGGSEFEERVEELKAAEARLINQEGAAAQLEYIITSYGLSPEAMDKARQDIKEVIMDFAPKGKLCRCTQCQADELRSRALKHGEGWLCEKCVKASRS